MADPISLALGAAVGALPSLFGGGGSSAPPTIAAPDAPPPASSPTGSKTPTKSQSPTFVGSTAAPDQRGAGASTLLGQ